jgi:hypothetical protein
MKGDPEVIGYGSNFRIADGPDTTRKQIAVYRG